MVRMPKPFWFCNNLADQSRLPSCRVLRALRMCPTANVLDLVLLPIEMDGAEDVMASRRPEYVDRFVWCPARMAQFLFTMVEPLDLLGKVRIHPKKL